MLAHRYSFICLQRIVSIYQLHSLLELYVRKLSCEYIAFQLACAFVFHVFTLHTGHWIVSLMLFHTELLDQIECQVRYYTLYFKNHLHFELFLKCSSHPRIFAIIYEMYITALCLKSLFTCPRHKEDRLKLNAV